VARFCEQLRDRRLEFFVNIAQECKLARTSPTSTLDGVKSFIYNELVFYSVTMWTSSPSFGGSLSPPREF
jgi:hypothetical protein